IASFRGGLSNDRHTIQDDLSQAAALAGFRALNDSTTNSNAQIVAIMIHAARIEARKYSISHEYEAKAYAFSTGKVDGWVRKSPRDAA
ncbi:MAG: hypothetical protein KDD60_07955, partial [Bdellovibrionales bacterium]|nr:hypothetical protein [Bdellovibrionales bacterium]